MSFSAAERLIYTTLHIEASGADGIADATGFLFTFDTEAGPARTIITNKHVIDDAKNITVTFHNALSDLSGADGTFLRASIDFGEGAIVRHPNDDVDLCAICFDLDEVINSSGKPIFNPFLTEGVIPSPSQWDEFDAFEEVIMIGCPNGLFDRHNHMPIVRRGITASQLRLDFGGQKEFLIDAACFAGSSGSPVFVYDQYGIRNKITNSLDLTARRQHLVGILYSGPQVTQEGKVLRKKQKKVEVDTMMHLGFVIKSTEILALKDELIRKLEAQP